MTVFGNTSSVRQKVAFAAPYPGKIIPVDLRNHGRCVLCQKDAFLAAAKGISMGIAFTRKLGAGLFGGEGFILQKLEGDGMTFLHAGGTVVERPCRRARPCASTPAAWWPSRARSITTSRWSRASRPPSSAAKALLRHPDRARQHLAAVAALLAPRRSHAGRRWVPAAAKKKGRSSAAPPSSTCSRAGICLFWKCNVPEVRSRISSSRGGRGGPRLGGMGGGFSFFDAPDPLS